MTFTDVATDGMQEMGLTEASTSVDEEGVVGLRRALGNGERSRMSEPVGRADHERVERVFWVETSRGGTDGARFLSLCL